MQKEEKEYHHFLKLLEFEEMGDGSFRDFNIKFYNRINNLKKEILNNLSLNSGNKIAMSLYLDSIKFELKTFILSEAPSTEELQKLCYKYNTTLDSVINEQDYSSPLQKILTSPKMSNDFKDICGNETEFIDIVDNFFNFKVNDSIKNIIEFVEEKERKYLQQKETIIGNSQQKGYGNSTDFFLKTELSEFILTEVFTTLKSKSFIPNELDIKYFFFIFNKGNLKIEDFRKINWKSSKAKLFMFLLAITSYQKKTGEKYLPNFAYKKLMPFFFKIEGKEIEKDYRPEKNDYFRVKTFIVLVNDAIEIEKKKIAT
ncbi:MAG: hypothetical protein HXX09_13740 [Bacteroidetes bacterium]|nr:hypothetical protein [Bacteroidota bacterium]